MILGIRGVPGFLTSRALRGVPKLHPASGLRFLRPGRVRNDGV
jgi:hypothetical protein